MPFYLFIFILFYFIFCAHLKCLVFRFDKTWLVRKMKGRRGKRNKGENKKNEKKKNNKKVNGISVSVTLKRRPAFGI